MLKCLWVLANSLPTHLLLNYSGHEAALQDNTCYSTFSALRDHIPKELTVIYLKVVHTIYVR